MTEYVWSGMLTLLFAFQDTCFKYHRLSGPPSFRLRKADQLSQFAQMPVTEAYVSRLSDRVQVGVPVSV